MCDFRTVSPDPNTALLCIRHLLIRANGSSELGFWVPVPAVLRLVSGDLLCIQKGCEAIFSKLTSIPAVLQANMDIWSQPKASSGQLEVIHLQSTMIHNLKRKMFMSPATSHLKDPLSESFELCHSQNSQIQPSSLSVST